MNTDPSEDPQYQERLEQARRVGMHLKQRAMDHWESLGDEERKDARQRAGIMNLESNPQDSAVERFRRNAAPSEFEFPLPRGFSTPFEVTQQGKELVEKTWEAFREKLDGGRGLPELRIVEEYLSRFEQELEEQANEKFGEVGRWYRLGNFEEEKRLEFVGWYEHQIHLTFQGGYIPPLWKELHPAEREWLIRVRRVAQRLRDAARGAAFRRAVLRNVLWEHVMYGEARKWEEIPEDEREDMTESDMPECFISHAEKDQKFAQKLHDDLEDKGIRCWIASEEIRIGEEFRSVIEEAIHRCKKVLLILSEDSIKSEWVKDEVEAALEKERADGRAVLLPLRIDEAVQCTRQAWAAKLRRQRQIGDFTNTATYDPSFQRLLRDLREEN